MFDTATLTLPGESLSVWMIWKGTERGIALYAVLVRVSLGATVWSTVTKMGLEPRGEMITRTLLERETPAAQLM